MKAIKYAILFVLLLAGIAEASPDITTPLNNQNLTADITDNLTTQSDNNDYLYVDIWYSSDNTTFTNLTTRQNSTQMWAANSSGEWVGTLGVADLSDGLYYIKLVSNGSNSTARTMGLDDTTPTASCSWLKRLPEGKIQTVTCTITDDGFTTALIGNATIVTGDRLAGTKTMTGSAGNYKWEFFARSMGLREAKVTAFDDHSLSSSTTLTYNVLEGSAEVAPEIGTSTTEGVTIEATQTQTKRVLAAILGAFTVFLILSYLVLMKLRIGTKKRKR